MANVRWLLFVLVAALVVVWLTGGAPACAVSPAASVAAGRPGIARTPPALPAPALEVGDPTRRPQVATAPTGRDLFREQTAPPPANPAVPAPVPSAVLPRPTDAQPTPGYPDVPRLALAGVAEDAGTRIAVVSGGGDVWLVKAGAMVAGRFRVESIAPDAVILSDTRGGPEIRLRLR